MGSKVSSLLTKICKKSVIVNATKNVVKYYKLPYTDYISWDYKRKINRLSKFYCIHFNTKVVLNPFKVADILKVQDSITKSLKSFAVYKFLCARCNNFYIGEITHHLSTRIKEHLETDKKSQIFTHLVNTEACEALSTEKCLEIIESVSTPFRLELKEAMHITWKKSSLNKQEKNVSISITV